MSSFPPRIPTNDLKLDEVPDTPADWNIIARFALTFDPKESDPYKIKLDDQSFEVITSDTDLVFLRSRLFLEQRRWNHFGREPDEAAITGVRKIIPLIRSKLNK